MTERQKREAAAYQFELQAHRLYMRVIARHTNYRYTVVDEMQPQELTAMVLASTWDYYRYRINRGRQRVDLLVVQHHNAVVPVRTICLSDGSEYAPGALPAMQRQGAKRRNHEETLLLVSKLILGVESAKEELAHMPARTRQRYLQRCEQYLKPRVGRPWAS
jgi:hypothetical protein